jgi:formimidoylglutamate deiminase
MEMLLAGYTRVAEFQYLHHQQSGQPYEDCAEMSLQVLQAAESAGIGITCLPVHYQFSGFGEQEISPQQRRFFTDPEAYLRLVKRLELHLRPNANQSLGIAGHSLRATSASTFNSILQALQNEEYGREIPVHMHIAEQIKEVEDCVSWSGMRCVEYCLEQFPVDQHWCLIHATHMTETEAQELAQSGAVVGLCPTTEANLGDGLFNAMPFLDAGGKIGIGSDSHISVSAVEELRWLEYGQRLMNHSRNQLARGSDRSTGRALVELAAIGGAQACGHPAGTLEVGKRADLVVLDDQNPLLIEREGDTLLDSWVFSGNANSVRDVYVGGQHVVQDGRHPKQEIINQTFRAAMRELTA